MSAARIRVGVLAGGASSERQISLATGLEIAQHLPPDRYEVVLVDPLALMANNPRLSDEMRDKAAALLARGPGGAGSEHLEELPVAMRAQIEKASTALVPANEALASGGGARPIDVAFIAIHGRWGEDGTLQGMLDLLGVPYVGSGVLASALAMDKPVAKVVLGAHGIDVPRGFVIEPTADGFDRDRALSHALQLGLPLVVKPVAQGSSFGTTLVDSAGELLPAIDAALEFDERVLVEERLIGTELTVGVLEEGEELVALPVIEIVTKHAFFDYRAKYDPSLTDEICPARISDELAAQAQAIAMRAHRALGCRDLSRADMIATADGRLAVLEVNTIPGMTANSLLPKAAEVAGISFGELCGRLVERAMQRGQG